ncbi:MAG: hypothetical protein RJA57_312 [Bacteroidota bacterium]|jgi:outer membrane protein
MLIWNILLSLVAGYFLYTRLVSTGTKGTAPKTDVSGNGREDGRFRMAYFEMDSVAAHFELVKEVKAELAKKEEDINREMETLARGFQQKYQYYQNQAQAGSLNETQAETASQEIKKLDDQMKARKQQLDQEYSDLMVRRQNDIKSKIEAFLKEYNTTRNFSYIISYEQGLFYYRDTAYNITPDVVKGLNQLYKPASKK